MKQRNGWLWVPSLYLYQGIPYSIVMTTSALFYKNMGIPVEVFTFWTSMLYLPWTLKPLWSPYVEKAGTKRQWVCITQLLIGLAFIALGLSFNMGAFFSVSLCLLAVIAFGSASHDIACDGFYMLALPPREQQFFVGIRTTFYRVAMVTALGLMPMIVDVVQKQTGMEPIEIAVNTSEHQSINNQHFSTWITSGHADTLLLSIAPTANTQLPSTTTLRMEGQGADDYRLSEQTLYFGSLSDTATVEIVPSANADHSIAAHVRISQGNVALGWTLALGALGIFLIVLMIYNNWSMPRPADNTASNTDNGLMVMKDVLKSFFCKPGALPAILFLLLYRLGEAQLSKIATPFLIDSRANGGLGMSMTQYGTAYGTAGMIALTAGGILGGWLASKYGLKKMIWWMVAFMNIPNVIYVLLAMYQPSPSDWSVYAAIVAEQAGYGFGFTAYMLFLLEYVGESKYKTAQYALGTAIMSIGMMLPSMLSGFAYLWLGYGGFFIYVLACCIPGTILAAFLPIKDRA